MANPSRNEASVTLSSIDREKLLQVGSATVANVLLKRGFRNVYMLGLNAVGTGMGRMVGPAFTLRFIPAREDLDTMANYSRDDNLHRRAIEECPAGSVLVIATGGCLRSAAAGDIMAARLHQRGGAGIVTDGGFRDSPGIRRIGIPAYQRQSAPPATPIAMHPVELNGPIGCADVPVYPGDVLVGDDEGVSVIPSHLVSAVADEALEAVRYEEFVDLQIQRGRSIFGLFPATPESKGEYQIWAERDRPELRGGKL